MIVKEINTEHFPLISIHGEPLIEKKVLIESFINNHLSFFTNIRLANAQRDGNKVVYSFESKENIESIENLDEKSKSELIVKFNAFRFQINDYFKSISNQDNPSIENWKSTFDELLDSKNIDIYHANQSLILLWGCEFHLEDKYSIPRDILEKRQNNDSIMESEMFSNDKLANEHSNNPENIKITNKSPDNNILVGSKKSSNINFLNRLFLGIIDFLIRGWWFILILLLIFYFLNKCACTKCSNEHIDQIENDFSNGSQRTNRSSIYLPPENSVRPRIDSTVIDYGDDSLNLIANDRINVALKRNQSAFYDFVDQLGQAFLDSSRKIIYFNEETARIQIQFDPDKEQNIKVSIRKAVPSYELLIWDESIFVSTYSNFTDPLLSDTKKNWYLRNIHMEKAWELTTGKKNVKVAIVDNGFDLKHPELKNSSIESPYNVIDRNNNVYGNTQLDHGTHVAGILLGTQNNGSGLAGIAPNVTFMPIQIGSNESPFFTSTDIIDGILYALKNKVDVINLSLGKQFSASIQNLPKSEQEELIETSGMDEEEFWTELFEIADKQNTTIVIAAGNSHVLTGIDPMQRHKNIILVGATDDQMEIADFSNYGSFNTINAPGVNIYSSIPGNKFEAKDGTSMASPIVAGAIALFKSINNGKSNHEIKQKLLSTKQENSVIDVFKFLK